MRVLLLGGSDLTLAVAKRLVQLGIEVAGVAYVGARFDISYAPAGVRNFRAVDIGDWCDARHVPTQKYSDMEQLQAFARETGATVGLAAGWYHIVPRTIRAALEHGCLGLHASLLPKLRGGAPLNWAILSGESETGVSLFQLGDGVDDGPLYAQRAFPIGPRATIGELVESAERVSLELVDEVLPRLEGAGLQLSPQEGVPSYCLQRRPEDGRIDWRQPVSAVDKLIRAVGRPYPGAHTVLQDRALSIWRAEPLENTPVHGLPGQLARLPAEADPCVVCGEGTLVVRDVSTGGEDALALLRRAANERLEIS